MSVFKQRAATCAAASNAFPACMQAMGRVLTAHAYSGVAPRRHAIMLLGIIFKPAAMTGKPQVCAKSNAERAGVVALQAGLLPHIATSLTAPDADEAVEATNAIIQLKKLLPCDKV